ncbi:hypothetical protein P152DRAFT_456446 [Eremomyces bilateralis CBS 781.70]|uniref:HMG box domain-containing protein n=1 Tax=Eremomyces bilateralis CBS 781.70 TaxID=1392243 RepID=A0A6G1G822_9PEZI|nr:uncharacterized protein P152DRAFT_456446 [Eremomyces bilateralis CBS 781.70]KAF1814217.1 hypothetical protein P152DRAFT_456446 [Eremomyces bilateralis CBS 781.70]
MFRHAVTRRVTFAAHQRTSDVARLACQLRQLSCATDKHSQPKSSLPVPFLSASRRAFSTTLPQLTPAASTSAKKTTISTSKTTIRKAKPKSSGKKTAPKKPKKKVLTEEQQAAKESKGQREEIKTLRDAALLATEPPRKNERAWTIYLKEQAPKGGNITEVATAAAQAFKQLTAAETEHYNSLANANRVANDRAYDAWVQSHTPEQIRLANIARKSLNHRAKSGKTGTAHSAKLVRPIKDERQVKQPLNALILYTKQRWESGDLKGIAPSEAMKLVAGEWKALGEAEKKIYTDMQAGEVARYEREYKQTYGHPRPAKPTKAGASGSE